MVGAFAVGYVGGKLLRALLLSPAPAPAKLDLEELRQRAEQLREQARQQFRDDVAEGVRMAVGGGGRRS